MGSLVVARRLPCCGTWVPECMGSVVAACGLSCPAPCGILVPRPGIEPMSPALEGGLSTTGPPGKSKIYSSINCFYFNYGSYISTSFQSYFLLYGRAFVQKNIEIEINNI